MRRLTLLSSALLLTAATAPVATPNDEQPARIQWFGTWEQGQEEAARTGRPILLTSAAPHCGGMSGMW